MSVVSAEFGVGSLEGRVARGLGLLDAVAVRLRRLVVLGTVLRLGHCCGLMVCCQMDRTHDTANLAENVCEFESPSESVGQMLT